MITEIFYFSWTKIYLPFQFFQQRRKVKFRTFDNMVYYGVRLFKKSQWAWSKINAVTVLNMYEVYTSTGCPKLGLRVCQQWEKSAVQIYAAVGSSKKNRQRRLHELDDGMSKSGRKTRQGHRLTRTGAVEEFGSEDIGSLHTNANSAAHSSLCKSGARLDMI